MSEQILFETAIRRKNKFQTIYFDGGTALLTSSSAVWAFSNCPSGQWAGLFE